LPDILAKFIEDARKRVREGYYEVETQSKHEPLSLKRAIKSADRNAIIAEIKPASPVRGALRTEIDPVKAASEMLRGGAIALSVLTEADNFAGSLANFRKVREQVSLPLLMKDVIVNEKQIDAAGKIGADCVLLIEPVFSKYPISSLARMVRYAHDLHLEVLLEVHLDDEFTRAVNSEADLVGLNNRDLTTLQTNLETTSQLIANAGQQTDKVLVSESGFESAEDVRKVKPSGVDAFLIGSSIMLAADMERKVREFVLA